MNVLIVDDQRSARRVLADMIEGLEDFTLHEAASLEEARAILDRYPIDIGLIDVRLADDSANRDGLRVVAELREKTGGIPVVVTNSSEMDEIRAAMRAGAYDYILKDELSEELVMPIVEGLQRRRKLEHEVLHLRARLASESLPMGLIGNSAAMELLRATLKRVALSDRPALVVGPTGAGKELVVRAVHALGPNAADPLLDLNCGAIPETLMESQLFGHERGAFTGADRRQDGLLVTVRKGTLFLDEVAELPMTLQAKLLRVLETRRFRPLGSGQELRFEGRVVAATHADLEGRVREGRFREDLLYRLNVLAIRVPGLDERKEDIPALVAHFAAQQHRRMRFSEEALRVLAQRDWPGNVRQLRNLVDRLAVFTDEDPISPETIESLSRPATGSLAPTHEMRSFLRSFLHSPVPNKLEALEEVLLEEAMHLAGGNKSAAARLLGLHRKAVQRRLIKQGD
jgi:DNA-binding NtrC family response regulator